MNLERLFYQIISPNRRILHEPGYWTLGLISCVYAPAMKLRALGYRSGWLSSRKLNCRVISVGNLTLGGTGKTPMVLWIARLLKDRGRNPAILSRGYKGNARGPINVVSNGTRILLSPEVAGDEPVMMAQKLKNVPILIGTDRYLSGNHALEHFGVDTLILDDGFQNLGLQRDCNILLLDHANPFGNGQVFPAGHLRESMDALPRADLICFTHCRDDRPDPNLKLLDGIDLIRTRPRLSGWIRLDTGERLGVAELRGETAATFCGIACPDEFVNLLAEAGITVSSRFDFPDHHRYTPKDCQRVQAQAKGSGAGFIVTTEKDAVKLTTSSWHLPVFAASMELEFFDGDDILTHAILGTGGKRPVESER